MKNSRPQFTCTPKKTREPPKKSLAAIQKKLLPGDATSGQWIQATWTTKAPEPLFWGGEGHRLIHSYTKMLKIVAFIFLVPYSL